MKRITIFFVLITMIVITGKNALPEDESVSYKSRSPLEKQFLDTLQYRSFLFFINELNKESGLVKDRSASWSPASTASSGFGVLCWAIGAEKKWISREEAARLTMNLFTFLFNSSQSADSNATGYKGFYYHFLRMGDGKREWKCELSTIDSGFLYAAMLFARQYYTENNATENRIRELVEALLAKVEWDFFQFDGNHKQPYTIPLGWHPEKGFIDQGWTGYCESLVLYIVAAGMDMKNASEGYQTWLKYYDWRKIYGYEFLSFPPLMGHQYSHMFIDFKDIHDDFNRSKNIDYFETSRLATLVQRAYAVENPGKWKGYDSLCWGLTACDGPGDRFNTGDKKFLGYAGRGTSGNDLVFFDDGTIAPTAAAGSIPFLPDACIPTLMSMKEKYGESGLWGKYGFVDAFNPTLNWFNQDYIGIDQGPIVIMIENFKNGMIWKYVSKDPVIQRGLQRLGFRSAAGK